MNSATTFAWGNINLHDLNKCWRDMYGSCLKKMDIG